MRPSLLLLGACLATAGCAGGSKPDDGGPVARSPDVVASAAEERPAAGGDAEEALAKGRALEKEGRFDAAEVVYQDALRLDDVPPKLRSQLYIRMACRRYESGDYPNALEYARGAQHLRPDWDDAAEVAARIEKKMHAKRGGADVADAAAVKKRAAKGGVEDRLSRVEEQLAHVMKKLEGGTPSHAPEAKEKWAAAEKEMQGLREKIKRMHVEFETVREKLQKRIRELEEECEGLRRENAELRGK